MLSARKVSKASGTIFAMTCLQSGGPIERKTTNISQRREYFFNQSAVETFSRLRV